MDEEEEFLQATRDHMRAQIRLARELIRLADALSGEAGRSPCYPVVTGKLAGIDLRPSRPLCR